MLKTHSKVVKLTIILVLPPLTLPYLPDPTSYEQLLSLSLQLSRPSPVAPRVPGGLCPPFVPQGPAVSYQQEVVSSTGSEGGPLSWRRSEEGGNDGGMEKVKGRNERSHRINSNAGGENQSWPLLKCTWRGSRRKHLKSRAWEGRLRRDSTWRKGFEHCKSAAGHQCLLLQEAP